MYLDKDAWTMMYNFKSFRKFHCTWNIFFFEEKIQQILSNFGQKYLGKFCENVFL